MILLGLFTLIIGGTITATYAYQGPVYLPSISGEEAPNLKGYIKNCDTTHQATTVTLSNITYVHNELIVSDTPDGTPLASTTGNTLVISPTGPIAGTWWLWLTNNDGARISEPVTLQTHAEPGLNNCQQAEIIFYAKGSPSSDVFFEKANAIEPRTNSNSYISFFGWICKMGCPNASVGGYTLVVDGPLGRHQSEFVPNTLIGDPGLPTEFWYNGKVEIAGTAEGIYTVWVADSAGNQVSEPWKFTVEGETRTFFPRWFTSQP